MYVSYVQTDERNLSPVHAPVHAAHARSGKLDSSGEMPAFRMSGVC